LRITGPPPSSGVLVGRLLPVTRSSPQQLAALLGPAFTVTRTHMHEHTSPAGTRQPFIWIIARSTPIAAS
jgi:hypothetical protein